jgi:pyrimidine precursor biosynthesis enzyme
MLSYAFVPVPFAQTRRIFFMSSSPITFLLNWHQTAYHAPVLLAKSMGFFLSEGIDVAILEPSDPSDVTKIVGTKKVDFALKALVHCFAARERGYPVTSVACVFNEPPTGILSFGANKIQTVLDIKGKRIGYVGEFGKIMIQDIAYAHGISSSDITLIKVGMHGVDALMDNRVDGTIGINCIQGLELESRTKDSHMLRIDELADLGCCCFCSIALICHDDFLDQNRELVALVCKSLFKSMQFTVDNPQKTIDHLLTHWPKLKTPHFEKSFLWSLPYFSRHLENNQRDWDKVACYAERLGIFTKTDALPFTNAFLPHVGISSCQSIHQDVGLVSL